MYDFIQQKLDLGHPIILDGGTGTDIQRRGAPMSGDTWCAEVNLTHPDIVQAVHEDYIASGADVITANTFASSALSFNHYGRDDDLIEIDRAAVAIAKRAAQRSRVAIAGSVSTMRPVAPGSDRTLKERDWSEAEARRLFGRKVANLKACDVDFLLMEMMRDTDYSLFATEAAKDTGLPVWVGISVERDASGQLVGFGREDQRLEDVAPVLAATSPAVMAIMHTSPNDTDDALDILRAHWTGPMAVYPESGYFKSPDWQFVDVISPADLVAKSQGWKKRGASIFGGCCGIGPHHISALAKEFTS